jgi:hypothetical protein
MRCVPTPRQWMWANSSQWWVCQLLANDGVPTPLQRGVCQLLPNEVWANSSPSWVYQLLANDGVPIPLQWAVCQLLANEMCVNASPIMSVPTPRQWWCANSSPMRCVPASCKWGVCQLLANEVCANSLPKMVCQLFANDGMPTPSSPMRCVPTPIQMRCVSASC